MIFKKKKKIPTNDKMEQLLQTQQCVVNNKK